MLFWLIPMGVLVFGASPLNCQDTQDYCQNITAPATLFDIPDDGKLSDILKERIMPKISAYATRTHDSNDPYYPTPPMFPCRASYSTMAGCASICFLLEPVIGQSLCKLDDYGRPGEVPRCQEERRRSQRRKLGIFRYTYESMNDTLVEQIGNKAAENSTFWKCKGEQ